MHEYLLDIAFELGLEKEHVETVKRIMKSVTISDNPFARFELFLLAKAVRDGEVTPEILGVK